MPTRALSMRKIRELIRLKYQARLSHEQIAGALAISKGVVAKYVGRIERAGLEPKELMGCRMARCWRGSRRRRGRPATAAASLRTLLMCTPSSSAPA